MKMKIYILSALVICFWATGSVYAMHPSDIPGFPSHGGRSILPSDSDLGVENPGALPTSRLYFFKEWERGLRLFFTFNPVAKADLELSFANQKAAELRRVAEIQPQNVEAIKKAVINYEKTQERLKTRVEGLKKTSQNPNTDKLLEKIAEKSVQHAIIFDEIERKFEEKTEIKDIFERNKKAIEKTLEASSQKDEAKIEPVLNKGSRRVCAQNYDPVCGTDNKTYSNACSAVSAGSKVQHKGECGAAFKRIEDTNREKENAMTKEELEAYNKKVNDLEKCGPQMGAPGSWVCKDGRWQLF